VVAATRTRTPINMSPAAACSALPAFFFPQGGVVVELWLVSDRSQHRAASANPLPPAIEPTARCGILHAFSSLASQNGGALVLIAARP
jgi:hypothetical protein